MNADYIVDLDAPILVTGSAGFIGSRLIDSLQALGFSNLRCLVRSSASAGKLRRSAEGKGRIEFAQGNLLSREDCAAATKDVAVIYHLAAGTGTKSFADAYMNSVVTTRNLMDGALQSGTLRRFVNVSSFSVYSNADKPRKDVLDEACPVEKNPHLRDAYCFAKVKQDELVMEYGARHKLPYVLVRPGVVYGPGKNRIHGRVGLSTFGPFLHLGGSNRVPFTYVENCADAIALAGLRPGVDGEVFNIVDDDLPTSREFLRRYKRQVRRLRSVYVPRFASYLLCVLWEKYSAWSQGQLPPIHNRREWVAYWKPTRYSNAKLKEKLDWNQRISTSKGLDLFFASCREAGSNA